MVMTPPPPKPVKPLRPSEIGANKVNHIPAAVIEAVNELLTEQFTGGSVTIKQKEIVERAKKKMDPGARFNYDWLNFEPLFRTYGWKVSYDKPAYNEDYEPYFDFEPAK